MMLGTTGTSAGGPQTEIAAPQNVTVVTKSNMVIKIIQREDLTHKKISELEQTLMEQKTSNVEVRHLDVFTKEAKELIHFTFYAKGYEPNKSQHAALWVHKDTEEFFTLLKRAFPSTRSGDNGASIESMFSGLKYKLEPSKASTVQAEFQPIIDRMKTLDYTEAEMAVHVKQCFESIKRVGAWTEEFRRWVRLRLEAKKPADVEDFMMDLGRILDTVNSDCRVFTEDWGIELVPKSKTEGYHQKSASKHANKPTGESPHKRKAETISTTSEPAKKPCSMCGRSGHLKNSCLFKEHPDANKTEKPWENPRTE